MNCDRMLDAATRLYYNARFYDPSIMRFMTENSGGGTKFDPATQNLNAYAGDNPTSNIDPTGLDWWNPLTWSPSQWLLAGAFALTAISIAQLGSDPITDTLAAADIADLVGSSAALSGLPVITKKTVIDFTPDKLAALGLSREGNFPFQTAPPDVEWNFGGLNPDTAAATRQLAWFSVETTTSLISSLWTWAWVQGLDILTWSSNGALSCSVTRS